MIVEIPQLIWCGITMKSEITLDHAAPGARAPRLARAPRAGLHTPLTVTTRHSCQRHYVRRGLFLPEAI